MAPVSLENINKVYENGFHAVKDLSVNIADGEFMVLVGPSGCGKTTALRMVAGLEDITSGVLRIGGKEANDETPKERDIAMVFQNYALYPHMTVRDNIGFALKLRKLPKDQLNAKVDEAAEILGLTDWLERKPGQLSGGQRQRVAMGRAIVREPSVFLMDEPLSNLDAKLRVQMRAEVQRIQRRIGVSTIYVTHDQVEAMTMGDRVTVLRAGVLQQVDTPQVLYDNPDNIFVAAFIGSPSMNLYDATLGEGARSLKLGSQEIDLPESVVLARPALRGYGGKKVVVGLRPEHLPAESADSTGPKLVGDVELIEALGSEQVVHFTIDANRVLAEGAVDKDEAAAVRHRRRSGPRRGQGPGQGGRQADLRGERRRHEVLRRVHRAGDPRLAGRSQARSGRSGREAAWSHEVCLQPARRRSGGPADPAPRPAAGGMARRAAGRDPAARAVAARGPLRGRRRRALRAEGHQRAAGPARVPAAARAGRAQRARGRGRRYRRRPRAGPGRDPGHPVPRLLDHVPGAVLQPARRAADRPAARRPRGTAGAAAPVRLLLGRLLAVEHAVPLRRGHAHGLPGRRGDQRAAPVAVERAAAVRRRAGRRADRRRAARPRGGRAAAAGGRPAGLRRGAERRATSGSGTS